MKAPSGGGLGGALALGLFFIGLLVLRPGWVGSIFGSFFGSIFGSILTKEDPNKEDAVGVEATAGRDESPPREERREERSPPWSLPPSRKAREDLEMKSALQAAQKAQEREDTRRGRVAQRARALLQREGLDVKGSLPIIEVH